MNRSAHVESIDTVRALRVALLRFQEDASDALVSIEQEINRFLDWLEHNQLQYWTYQTRRASEQIGEARTNLERKRVMTVGGESPPCYEEKKVLARAKQRHQLAEEKVAMVRRMRREVDHEVCEVQGRLSALADSLAADVPKAAAMLERVATSLQQYTEIEHATPNGAASQATGTHDRSDEPIVDENSGESDEQSPPTEQKDATDASM